MVVRAFKQCTCSGRSGQLPSPLLGKHINTHPRLGYWKSHVHLRLLFHLQTGRKKGGSSWGVADRSVPRGCLNHDLVGKLHHQIPSVPTLPALGVPSAPCGFHCHDPVFHPNKGKTDQAVSWQCTLLYLEIALENQGAK